MPALLAVAGAAHEGGAEVALLRLLVRLRARGWEVALATPRPGQLADRARRLGLDGPHLAVGGLSRRAGRPALRSYVPLRRLARRAQVVYLNGSLAGRLLPSLAGRRSVLHVHDLVDRVPAVWRLASMVLAGSRVAAARLAPLRPHVVGFPVELGAAAAAPPWPQEADRPVIAYVGRIEPAKGVLDLARAAPALTAAGARVVVVGEDVGGVDRGYRDAVVGASGVEHYGWVEDAAGLMGFVDVAVLPSRREALGGTLAEAISAGTPVVATDTGGIPEVVEDGVTGRLIAPGDPAALVAAIGEVLDQRDAMAAACRARAGRWEAGAYADRVAALLATLAPAR